MREVVKEHLSAITQAVVLVRLGAPEAQTTAPRPQYAFRSVLSEPLFALYIHASDTGRGKIPR